MPDVPSSPPARPHLYWLDWLRFLAAFAVLIGHVWSLHWKGFAAYTGQEGSLILALLIPLCSLGGPAVVVFFVLSGWLVGGHALARARAGGFDATAYAADRLARVYVPLVPALLLTVAIARGLDYPVDPRQYVVCLFGLQGVSGISKPALNAPLWTLGYEVWFYVLAGGMALACRRDGASWRRFSGAAGAALATGICVALGWTYLAYWLVGATAGWLRARLAPAVRPWATAAGALLMVLGTWVYQVGTGILPPPSADLLWPVPDMGLGIVALGTLLLAVGISALPPRTRAGRWVEQAGGQLAAFSYTLYLVNFPVLAALHLCLGARPAELTALNVLSALGWAAVCMAVSLGMYALFERQTPQVRRWLRTRLANAAWRPTPTVTTSGPAPHAPQVAAELL